MDEYDWLPGLLEPVLDSAVKQNKKTSLVWVRERTIPTERPPLVDVVRTFADRGCHVVSVTDAYGRILRFLDRSRYFFFQVAPQLYSRG
jgi:CBS-domain-containing membrane protein